MRSILFIVETSLPKQKSINLTIQEQRWASTHSTLIGNLNQERSFQTPEAVMVFSSTGLGGMSRTFHELYRTRLTRGMYKEKERPILVNNWEATYFDFNADKILDIAKTGQELGMELVVLDDGWFEKRNSDHSSLGDWFVDTEKLPNGLG